MLAKRIVIEGPDRVGKKTQTNLLTQTLCGLGFKVKLVEVPFNDGCIYPIIYWMLANGFARKHPNLFQFVQFLNKFLFQLVLLPAYSLFYDFIVFDRWSLSSLVYGTADGANLFFNKVLFCLLVKPHHLVILAGDSHIKPDEDDYERDGALQQRVRNLYSLYVVEPIDAQTPVSVVRANEPKAIVHANILNSIHDLYTTKF